MAIQPIDLQTLYSQMDKVSKDVAFQQKGVYLNRDVNQADQQKKIDEQHKAIEKAKKEETDADKVKERQEQASGQQGQSQQKKSEEQQEEPKPEVQYNWITDPNLGSHIDISG